MGGKKTGIQSTTLSCTDLGAFNTFYTLAGPHLAMDSPNATLVSQALLGPHPPVLPPPDAASLLLKNLDVVIMVLHSTVDAYCGLVSANAPGICPARHTLGHALT